jgi:hypothetical protein
MAKRSGWRAACARTLEEAGAVVWGKPGRAPRRRRRGQKESGIEEGCRLLALAEGWVSRKMNGLGFRDWPDRLFVPPERRPRRDARGARDGMERDAMVERAARRRPFWVEFKKPGEEPTPSQWKMIRTLRARGERVYVCHSKQEFTSAFETEQRAA